MPVPVNSYLLLLTERLRDPLATVFDELARIDQPGGGTFEEILAATARDLDAHARLLAEAAQSSGDLRRRAVAETASRELGAIAGRLHG